MTEYLVKTTYRRLTVSVQDQLFPLLWIQMRLNIMADKLWWRKAVHLMAAREQRECERKVLKKD
jgi:hypothetical protein